jgi:membrane AbrB-like protein
VRALTLPSTFWPAALCVAIAFTGGFVFNYFQFPLAYMLGAIAFTMTAAISGVSIARPNAHIVTPMRASLGVLLGSAVTPALLERVGALGAAAAFVPVFVVVSGVLGTIYYIRVAKFSREEAFFCAVPGGLHVMTIYAEECGVDIRRVALAHALRITFVVLLTPLAVGLFTHVPRVDVATVSASIFDMDGRDFVLLLIAGCIGWYVGRKTRIPGGQMLGPMLASAALHVAGITTSKPPYELIILSQVIIGGSIGARYVGETLAIVRMSIVYAFGHVSITLAIAAVFAYVLHLVFDLPVITGLLSFAPGGMSEIGLIALGLGLDVGFVATIQVSRLSTIAVFAPWAFRNIRSFLKD